MSMKIVMFFNYILRHVQSFNSHFDLEDKVGLHQMLKTKSRSVCGFNALSSDTKVTFFCLELFRRNFVYPCILIKRITDPPCSLR